jgi:hypothetical protein
MVCLSASVQGRPVRLHHCTTTSLYWHVALAQEHVSLLKNIFSSPVVFFRLPIKREGDIHTSVLVAETE